MRAPLAAVLLVAACGGSHRPAAHGPSGLPASTPKCADLRTEPIVDGPGAKQTGFELVAAGREPRKQLRYAPEGETRVGRAISVVIDFDNGTGTGPLTMPETTLHIVHDSQSGGADAIAHRLVLEGSEVTSRGLPQASNDAVAVDLLRSRCASLTVRTDARGQSRGTTLAGANASAAQMLQLFEEFLQAFPEQAVGVGAKWTITTSQVVGGVTVAITTDVELAGLDDDGATLKHVITGEAAPQTVTMDGMTVDVTSLRIARTIEMKIDLRTMEIQGASRGGMTMEGSGGSETVKLQMHTSVTIHPE